MLLHRSNPSWGQLQQLVVPLLTACFCSAPFALTQLIHCSPPPEGISRPLRSILAVFTATTPKYTKLPDYRTVAFYDTIVDDVVIIKSRRFKALFGALVCRSRCSKQGLRTTPLSRSYYGQQHSAGCLVTTHSFQAVMALALLAEFDPRTFIDFVGGVVL